MSIRWVRALLVRLAGVLNRDAADREFAEELESHIQMHVDDKVRSGLSPEEARRQALVKLGGVEATRETQRQRQRVPIVEIFFRDLRHGARKLVKNPGFSAVAIVSLALGIGANTAIFSMVNTAALRPLPIDRPEQIVALANVHGNRGFPTFSYPNYRDFRDRNDVFDGLIGYRFAPLSISHDGTNERLWGYVVTGNYFDVLGVKAAYGRAISPEDDRAPGAHPVAVLSYDCWQRRFGAQPDAVGKDIIVNGRNYTVIGIAPEGFFGTEIIAAPEVWFPMAMQEQIEVGDSWLEKRGVENVFLQGRLKPGVTAGQARSQLNAIAAQLADEFPDENDGMRVMVSAPGFMGGLMRGPVIGFTGFLLVVVGFVLVLACTNLANLLLARVADRRKEMAVRLALGAGRLRLVWQLLAESLLLAAIAGVCGCVFAYWLLQAAMRFKPPVDVPLLIDFHIDYRVLIFACFISLATGVLFGLAPALQATKVDLQTGLKDETPLSGFRRSWFKSGLIVFQVALSLVLLVGGGLMLRALQQAQTMNLGFRPENAVEASFDLRLQGYDDARGLEFQDRLLDRVRQMPGVQAAGLIDLAPVDLHFTRRAVFVEGQASERDGDAPQAMASRVGPGYFQAMDTRLLFGRDFTKQDDDKATRVAIVNETFARRFWPDQNPIGKRFSQRSADAPMLEVVGVVQDGKYAGLNESPQPWMCRPLAQAYTGGTTLIVRTTADPQQTIASIRNEFRQLDPNLPLASAKPLVDRLAMPLLPARLAAFVLASFGLLALALAAIGIYGVMSHAVARRTREIGIRMALGAQASDVLRLALSQGMILVLIGVGIGLSAALGLTQLAKGLLFGVSATDPLTYVGVAVLLTGVALLACYVPARRASRIDPMLALRQD